MFHFKVLYNNIYPDESQAQPIKSNFDNAETKFPKDGGIEVVIDSSNGPLSIFTSQKKQFFEVSSHFCEVTGWDKNETRFTLDGDRLQDDLTMEENDITNGTVIDAFKEMTGGFSPEEKKREENEQKILKMLEQCDSDTDETTDEEVEEASEQKHPDIKLYEELKLKLKDGKLELNRANDQDKKLCMLLETETLQPYELIRLRNVFTFWEKCKPLREEHERSKAESKTKTKALKIDKPDHKRSYDACSVVLNDEATPIKRKKLLDAFNLETPSPLLKRSQISEKEMKQLSVSVHLWADRKMGGVSFLQQVRLNDTEFEDILKFTGSNSKWNLMKTRTLPQLRKLWRNTLGGKKFYRGHNETGFETEHQVHSPDEPYCPFGHCSSGFMSPMDLDLMRLTPKKVETMVFEDKRKISSRKLFDQIIKPSVSSDSDDSDRSTDHKKVQRERQVDSLDSKNPEGISGYKHVDSVISKGPEKIKMNMQDSLVSSKDPKKVQRDSQVDFVSSKEPEKIKTFRQDNSASKKDSEKVLRNRQVESVSIKDPKKVLRDRQVASVSSKDPEKIERYTQGGSVSSKDPENVQRYMQVDSVSTKDPEKVQRDRQVDSVSSNDSEQVLSDRQVEGVSSKDSEQVLSDRQVEGVSSKDPEQVLSERQVEGVSSKESEEVLGERQVEGVSSNGPKKVQMDRQVDSVCSKEYSCVDNTETQNKCAEDKIEKLEDDEPNFICNICSKGFHTFSGFERHNADKHNSKERFESTCPVCEKRVIYLEQHMKAKHSKQQKPEVCDVCLHEVNSNMQKHRKDCIKCRYCKYENSKKARLLNHIEKCTMQNIFKPQDSEPLDLRSPLKQAIQPEKGNQKKIDSITMRIGIMLHEPLKPAVASETAVLSTHESEQSDNKGAKKSKTYKRRVEKEKVDIEKARKKYPFDTELSDEEYYSEIDIDDTELFTVERRKHKDDLELKLREVDLLTNTEIEGDNMLINQFTEFMRNKYKKENKGEGYSKQTEPTTINLYSDVVRKDILKAFHKLISPFDAMWLVDCKTPKFCTFEGEERLHVKPEEPIYMTSRILQEALKNTQTQKKRVIAAFNQLMEFIELHFTLKLNAFGVDVLTKVQSYHKGVKSFTKATSQWKNSKEEERESYEKNKLIKDFKCPNKDAEVLEKYKKYIKSNERILKINKLLSYAHPDAESPTAAVMTDLGVTVMEEIVACTGCRPKVVRHLNMAAYVDAKPGFNPYDVTGEEATLEEDVDGEEIWRRVNPNRPPKEKACSHQIQNKSAICSEGCENQCIPEGFNFWITWDKTQSTKGPYFLHIPTPIKNLMDRYDIVRSSYFKGKKPSFAKDEHWLEDEETPFFLNSACNSFPSLNLKKLSDIFGIDVTGYSFRKIVVTWALNHKSAEIRSAEEESLQHSLKVAKDRYMQNKQTTPQNLVQTYVQEENLFPESLQNEINKGKGDIENIIAERQEKRAKMRFSKLMIQHEVSRKVKFVNRSLGLRNSILETDRSEFVKTCEEVTGCDIESILTTLKPLQWRNLIVRITCSTAGESGEKLRSLWIKIYKGDLQFGIREERNKAKQDNWPLRKQNPGRKDRNSWIAHGLRKSCLAAQKFKNVKQ